MTTDDVDEGGGLGLDAQVLVALAEQLRFGLILFGPDGRIREASPAMERMSGYLLDELRALDDPTELFTEGSREPARSWMARHDRGDEVEAVFEGGVRHKSGEVRTVKLSRIHTVVGGERCSVLALQRIDDRVALEQRHRLLGEALEQTPLAVVVFHLEDGADPSSLEVVAANATAELLIGTPLEPGPLSRALLQQSANDPIGLVRRAVEHLRHERTYVEERQPGLLPPEDPTRVRCSVSKVGPAAYAIFIEDVTGQHRAEAERRALLERLLVAADDERRRIADGLHDDIIQRLAAAALFAESAQQHAEPGVAARLAQAAHAVRSTIAGLRRLIFELSPPELGEHGLEATVRMLAEHLFAGSGTVVTVTCTGPVHEADSTATTICYRLSAEALINARKHARARHVDVEVTYDSERLDGRVVDDGLGMEGGPEQLDHFGLRTMRERAAVLGGSLTVGPGLDGRGTEVAWSLPAARVPTEARSASSAREWRPPGTVREALPSPLSFEAMAEASPDIIGCFDRSLRHLYVNPAAEAATGIPRAEFIGRTNRDLGMPDHLVDEWDEALGRAFSTAEPVKRTFKYDSPTGIRRFHALIIPEVDGERVTVVWGIVRDVTAALRD